MVKLHTLTVMGLALAVLNGELGAMAQTGKIDYRQLEQALSSSQWEKANQITSGMVLDLAGQKSRGYLIATDTRNLPCEPLRKIDQLWVKYSKGQFGFSIQGRIWGQIKGKNYEDSVRFEKQVGWQQQQTIFDQKTAPKGYLPLRPANSAGIRDAWGGGWIQEITQKLKSCRIL